jgi:deoxyribodipyrimidine photo-lyase
LHDYVWTAALLRATTTTRNEMLGEAFSTEVFALASQRQLVGPPDMGGIDAYEAEAGRNGKGSQQLRMELVWRDYFRLLPAAPGPTSSASRACAASSQSPQSPTAPPSTAGPRAAPATLRRRQHARAGRHRVS